MSWSCKIGKAEPFTLSHWSVKCNRTFNFTKLFKCIFQLFRCDISWKIGYPQLIWLAYRFAIFTFGIIICITIIFFFSKSLHVEYFPLQSNLSIHFIQYLLSFFNWLKNSIEISSKFLFLFQFSHLYAIGFWFLKSIKYFLSWHIVWNTSYKDWPWNNFFR